MPVDEQKDVNAAPVEAQATETAVQETSPDPIVEQPENEESHEEKRGPTGWIPKQRLDEVIGEREASRAELQREREERIRLEERVKSIEESKAQAREVKPLTRVQLRQMVEAGSITQDEAEEHWATQVTKQAADAAARTVETRTTEAVKLQQVLSGIGEYTSILPSINQRGTPEWQKASQEYTSLVDLEGHPKTELQKQRMMLVAVKAAFGNVSDLKRRVDATRTRAPERETMAETTSTARRPSSTGDKQDPIKALSPEQRAHYEKMFQKTNSYPNGWDDVRKELSYQRPSLARRGR